MGIKLADFTNDDFDDTTSNLDSYDTKAVDKFIHDDSETIVEGKPLVKKKYRRTVENSNDNQPLPIDIDAEVNNFEPVDAEMKIDSTGAAELARDVSPEDAKQQMKVALFVAMAGFGELPKLSKDATNDNFPPLVSWPLREQLSRSTFEPDRTRRTKFIITARYIRDQIDLASADPLGDNRDCDVQRTDDGHPYFDYGQTLDRKKRIYDAKNNEPKAERYDGSVRTAKKSVPIAHGLNQADPLAFRMIVARQELDAIRLHIGLPLWPVLVSVISENWSMTDVGLSLGAKGNQAPPVGTAVVRLALNGAIDALNLLNGQDNEPQRRDPMPGKSTASSYWNLSSGPVMKVAA